MTGISQHGLYLLSMDSLLEISSCAIITFLIMAASSAVLVGSLIWVSRIIQSKTVKRLQGLPYIRQHFPFQQQWIFMNACDQPMAPVGFSTMVFATVSGFHAVFQRFGRYVVYLGFRPLVILFKAEYVEEVLSSNKLLTKGDEYEFLHGWLGTGLLTSAGEKWRSRRRLFTPAFHFRILDDFMGTINAQSFILAAKLGELCLAKQPFDVLPVVTMCTLDTICETVMGTTINAQSNTSSPYVKAVDRLGEIVLERMFRPLLHVNFIFQLLSVGREHRKCLKTLHSFTRKVIAERKASLRKEIDSGLVTLEDDAASNNGGRKTPRPFMDLLLLEHLKGNITEDGIREEVDTFMFGESQRVYPSVPFISRTCTEPVTIGGVELPENSVIQIATYFLHRDPKVFPKPEEFIPERFLPENAKGRHPYAYVPFSAGPRNCIGQKYALAEEKIVIANILRRFKIKSLNQRDQVALAAEIVLKPRSDLRIEFTPR
ncbi:cytochrome P450 4c3-like isoform X2 [Haemaphysalis longicornis]